MYGIAGVTAAVDSSDIDELVVSGAHCDKFTLVSGQNVVRGEVLGVITSGGKLASSISTASDGSQTPALLAGHDVDATGGDKEILCYDAGRFNANQVVVNATGAHTVDSIKAALRDVGILLEDPVKRYP